MCREKQEAQRRRTRETRTKTHSRRICRAAGPKRDRCERRDRERVDRISQEREHPVTVEFVRKISRGRAQRVTHEFAETCYKPQNGSACAQRTEKWSDNPARALVCKIGEEIYDPGNDNEMQLRSILHFTTNGHEFRK